MTVAVFYQRTAQRVCSGLTVFSTMSDVVIIPHKVGSPVCLFDYKGYAVYTGPDVKLLLLLGSNIF